MIHFLGKENSLVRIWINELRDKTIQKDRMRFRRNMERIGEVAAYEISKTMLYQAITTETPMGTSDSDTLESQPVIATILRAGLPLHQGLLNYFDHADASFIAAYRKHLPDGSFEIEQNYLTTPDLEDRILLLADPMLATGASLDIALQQLYIFGTPIQTHIISAIASTEGIDFITRKYPKAHLWVAAIDEQLTAKGYIVPGLGDAGDLSFGSKKQN